MFRFLVLSIAAGLVLFLIGASQGDVSDVVAAEECSALVLDFADLPAGTRLGEQYASQGIHISAVANEGRPNQLIVFDSDASGTRDPKMEVGLGNLAIIPEHLEDGNSDGLVDVPNNSIRGGKQIYTFDPPRTVGAIVIVEIDHGNPRSHFVAAYDVEGKLIKQVPIPIGIDGNFQTIPINASDVSRLEIVYRDSAGVTTIILGCSLVDPQDPSTSIVSGTMSIRPPETGSAGLLSASD